MKEIKRVNIVGAGLSGLSAAIHLAEAGIGSNLISSQPSERAQSVLAEGGINAALDTMGENDSIEEHFADTMKGGCFLEAESAVKNITDHAPEVVRELVSLGVPFRSEKGRLILRNFGGQKKKRTAYAKSSTGKILMTALIDETRKYEAAGLVCRYPHHDLIDMEVREGKLVSIKIRDSYSGQTLTMTGTTILCCGGLNGFFEGMTTGTRVNTGHAAAIAFARGVCFKNLEFIQYHPTTVGISNKRMLISEAARGEGGRLFIMKKGEPWYFMEEKYPELGNLMPRDVVSREMTFVKNEEGCSGEICLDMTGIDKKTWETKLSDLRKEIMDYLGQDPKTIPIAVSPGIHFFMGGIGVDDCHRTNVEGLFAAGEAACKYHGANRLGGNSLLGAVFGGKVAAVNAALVAGEARVTEETEAGQEPAEGFLESDPGIRHALRDILLSGLGIVRTREGMEEALKKLNSLYEDDSVSGLDHARISLAIAMTKAALTRKESRGAHYRVDYPETAEEFKKQSCALSDGQGIRVWFEAAGKKEA